MNRLLILNGASKIVNDLYRELAKLDGTVFITDRLLDAESMIEKLIIKENVVNRGQDDKQ